MTPSSNWTYRPHLGGWYGVFNHVVCIVRVDVSEPQTLYLLTMGNETTPRRYGYLPGDADMANEIERYRRREEIRARRRP